MSKPGKAALFVLFWLFFVCTVYADSVWTGGISSDFSDPDNWTPVTDVLDDSADLLGIGVGNPFDPVYNHKLPVRPNAFNTMASSHFTMIGGELLPYGNNTLNGLVEVRNGWMNLRGSLYIGQGATGTVTVDGGALESKYTTYIGRNSGGDGFLNVLEGTVYFSTRPSIASNGAAGGIYIEPGGYCYQSGNDTAWFQGLVDSGYITTRPGAAVVVDYQAGTNRTRVTAQDIIGASLPVPWDQTEDIDITILAWVPGTLAASSRVYLGTDEQAVENATTSDTNLYLGTTTGSSRAIPFPLINDTTYYWRVDTVASTGFIKGRVWSFTPVDVIKPRQMERLDRGVVALRSGSANYIGWRLLGTDPQGIAFNIYRGGVKLNSNPITGSTNYVDTSGSAGDLYTIRPLIGGLEQTASRTATVQTNPYYSVPVQQVPGDVDWSYEINDGAVGDLDGDGAYELVVKRFSGDYDEYPVIEAYKLDGTFLWRINLGPNHLAMPEIDPIVYDFDSDGYAELALRTCEGMTDAGGTQIGDTDGDGVTDYRPYGAADGYIDAGPEFLSIFDGRTGIELARTDYIPRTALLQWGDTYGHRANKFHMVVAYLDGHKPSLVICRGIYGLTKLQAWNYRNGRLYQLWDFNSEDWPGYAGQGNHNLTVGDVDGDRKDEIVYGGMCVDHDGTGLYSTGQGHGDAIHMSDMIPDRPGLEVWRCVETAVTGAACTDAATGEVIFEYNNGADVGRACAGDIDPRYPGYEMWGSTNCPMYSSQGVELGTSSLPMNFMIWWDGDLLRELLDHAGSTGAWYGAISKWDYTNWRANTILAASGTLSDNWTKGNPVLSGDILGDWREEALWRSDDNRFVRIYTTTIPTEHRIYTLMHDPQYRLAIAWQSCGYNQPPHPGFYLGTDMDEPPVPYIELTGFDPDDVVTPAPNPMGWELKPYAGANHSIAMQADTANDASGVEYYFTCTSGGGHDSGWQMSPFYQDTGLTEGITHTYTVKARDKSPNKNVTMNSVPASAVARATTLAYWRFEEGPADTLVPHGGLGFGVYYEGTADSSGNGYGLSVWADDWANYTYKADVGTSRLPQTGVENKYSAKHNDDFPVMYTDASDAISSITLPKFTIEASFKLQDGDFRTIVGRDSMGAYAGESALAALYLQAMPNNALAIKFCDVSGYWHQALSSTGVFTSYDGDANPDGTGVPWYSIAAVSNGSTLSLYLKNITAGDGWQLIAQANIAQSGSPNTTLTAGIGSGDDWTAGTWTVGRGLYGGSHTDRAYGYIDEVRISDVALPVSRFLSTQSESIPWLYGDFNGDHVVNNDDMAIFSNIWLWEDCQSLTDFDLDDDCMIGVSELSEMANNWLTFE